MKKVYLYYLFFFVWFHATTIHTDGFVGDTFVRTPHGSVAIHELAVGHEILTCTFNNSRATEPIANIICHEVDVIIRLAIDDDTLELAHDQLLFIPLQQKWLPASLIQPGMYLLGFPLRALRVQAVAAIEQKTQVYALSLDENHTYLVGKYNIVVHNFGECALITGQAVEGITFLNAFLMANPLVAPITIGVGGTALVGYLVWNAVSEIKESRKAKRDKSKNAGDSGQPEAPKNSDSDPDPTTVRAVAIALLKTIDESKDKAVEVFNKTCEWLRSSDGLETVKHCFFNKPGHNFGPLLARMGANTPDDTLNQVRQTKILIDITQQLVNMGTRLSLDTFGVFKGIVLEYGGELITVQGRVIDGMIKVSTMFIQPQHVR